MVVNKNFNHPRFIANGGVLTLPEGEYDLTLSTKLIQDITITEEVEGGKRDTVKIAVLINEDKQIYRQKSSYPVLKSGKNLEIITDRDSRVSVNGTYYGYGSVRLMVKGGEHTVITAHPEAGRTVREIVINPKAPRYRTFKMYNKPKAWNIRLAGLLPGGGQRIKEEPFKSTAIIAGFSASAVLGLYYQHRFVDQRRAYRNTLKLYRSSRNEETALRMGKQVDRLYAIAEKTQKYRNLLFGSLSVIYLYSLLDAWLLKPKGGYRNSEKKHLQLQTYLGKQLGGATVTINF